MKTLLGIAIMGTSIAHAGIIADVLAKHEVRRAAASTAHAFAASASGSVATSGQVNHDHQGTQADAVIDYAQRTHAAAQGVVNRQLSNGHECAELVHQGKLPTSTLSQFKCVLSGPGAALAAARATSSVAVQH